MPRHLPPTGLLPTPLLPGVPLAFLGMLLAAWVGQLLPVLAFGLLWWGHDRTAPDSTLAELGRQLALDAEWLRHAGRP